jgi:hypothetical protein
MRRFLIPAAVLLIATGAQAQTYVPGQAQANVNQAQLQMQANQIQQLQRQNTAALSQPDPALRTQALVRQQQLQTEANENFTLQQRALAPGSDPADLTASLQNNGARLQQLQQQPLIPVR